MSPSDPPGWPLVLYWVAPGMKGRQLGFNAEEYAIMWVSFTTNLVEESNCFSAAQHSIYRTMRQNRIEEIPWPRKERL